MSRAIAVRAASSVSRGDNPWAARVRSRISTAAARTSARHGGRSTWPTVARATPLTLRCSRSRGPDDGGTEAPDTLSLAVPDCRDVDPLVAIGLVWMLGILEGGIVAVLAQRLATRDARALAGETFADARRLEVERGAAEERRLRRALSAELRQNIEATRTEQAREGRRPFARVQRSAWDRAQVLDLTDAQFATVTAAYQAGDIYNAGVEMMVLGTPPGGRVHGELDVLSKLAPEAHAAFSAALRSLE